MVFVVIGRCFLIRIHRPITGPVPNSSEMGARSEGACGGDECAHPGSEQRRESVACGRGVHRRHHRITMGRETTYGVSAIDISRPRN
jgi:hypothetical protein